ncbi:amidohydrolase [Thaumasiovibrio sp. DFM-14]|uniref:amidohydrolase n=1 Tax=Thaumasiovibrio sp. DFM-14 TaxID=3384792 RepID=UPI0039A12667
MKLKSLALALMVASGGAFANADLIFTNGDIIPMTGETDRAQAIAIKDGVIIAVGSNAEVLKEKGAQTEVRDLKGKTMAPGFIDSHAHIVNFIPFMGTQFLYPSPAGEADTMEDVTRLMTNYLATPGLDKDKVHISFGYDDSVIGRHPTIDDLDPISKGFKLCLAHVSGHLISCNSAGLAALGYDENTPNPDGGVIRRDDQGKMTGVLEESATYPVMAHLTIEPSEIAQRFKEAQEVFTKNGVTTAQEGLATKTTMQLMQHLASADLLDIDILAYPKWYEFEEIIETSPLGEYVNGLKVAGMKITSDGSPQGKTAYLSTPYFEVPHNHAYHYHGYPIMPQEELNEYAAIAFKHNAHLITHANGDAAAQMLLNAVDHAIELHGDRDHRTTIIHGQTMRLDQVQRAADLDMIGSFFPAHTFFWGDFHRDSVLGPWRASNISPLGWAKEFGLKYTIHMDAPVVLPNQLLNMWTAVNRSTRSGDTLGEWHKLTAYEALEAVTVTAAFQNFEENEKGSLEVGKRADLVILGDNPLDVDPMAIKDISVLETIKDGKTIYTL